jgi:hypothetical protein
MTISDISTRDSPTTCPWGALGHCLSPETVRQEVLVIQRPCWSLEAGVHGLQVSYVRTQLVTSWARSSSGAPPRGPRGTNNNKFYFKSCRVYSNIEGFDPDRRQV